MLLNVGALGLFTANAILQIQQWDNPLPSYDVALGLAVGGLALTIGAGFLGWKLVGTHHVGVDLSREQERLEPGRLRSRP